MPVWPGAESRPFVDFRAKILTVSPSQQAAIMGRSNLALVESGAVKWDDVVTSGRIRSLREVVSRNKLTVDQMVKSGVQRSLASEAHAAVNTGTHTASEDRRRQLIDALLAKGYTRDQIRDAAGRALGSRLGIGEGPSGPSAPPMAAPPTPRPVPMPPSRSIAALPPEKPKRLTPAQQRQKDIADRRVAESEARRQAEATALAGIHSGEMGLRDAIAAVGNDYNARERVATAFVEKHQSASAAPLPGVGDYVANPETVRHIDHGEVRYHFPDTAEGRKLAASLFDRLGGNEEITANLSRHTDNVYLTMQPYLRNEAVKKKLERMGLDTRMYAGAGGIANGKNIYMFGQYTDDAHARLAHEMSHNLAMAKYGDFDPAPGSDFNRAMRSPERPYSEYGATEPSEDFATSFTGYFNDKELFRRTHPKRFEVVERLLKDEDYGG